MSQDLFYKQADWDGVPYHSLDREMKRQFGGKVYKLSLSSGCTCPNRDGSIGTGGCIFCGEGGAGEFAQSAAQSIALQLALAKQRVFAKRSARFAGYIAYFQSFTNTYGSTKRLRPLFEAAMQPDDVLALSAATRPDCLPDEMIGMLAELNRKKPIWIELGLQTIHEDTARFIRRGYALPVFEDAVRRLKDAGIGTVVAHVIIGLPGEDAERTKETVRYLAALGRQGLVNGVKLHLLHVMRGTALAKLYAGEGEFAQEEGIALPPQSALLSESALPSDFALPSDSALSQDSALPPDFVLPPLPYYSLDAYADLITELVALLPPEMVIHRLTGDAPKRLLLSPLWTTDKKRVLNTIRRRFLERGIVQGQNA